MVYDQAGQTSASNEVHAKTLTTLALFNTPPAGTSFLVETRKYDAAGQLVARYDGKGNGTFYAYNAAGQQTKVTDALGHETTFTYDAAGRKTNELNALNGQTTFAYDTAGRLTSTTDALANVTQFGYDADGNQTTVTDARGNVTTRAYNSSNRLITVTDSLGHVTSFTYDAVGNKLNELNALNQQTTFTYDAAGRLIAQTDPANHVTSFEYDPVGNRTKVTDGNGNQTQSAYNLRNLRITETNALGHVTTFGYDAVGNRTSVTDGKGAVWTYSFDWANRETSMTQPDNTVEKKSYDANGNLLAKLKPDGNIIRYDYDKLNRLVKKDYPTGTDTTFAYDALGRRTQMVDSTGTTTYTYDPLGRLLSCTQPCGAVSKTVSYSYDAAGNRATMTDPDGGVQTYSYDNNNRLASTTSPYAGTTSYVYDAIGRVSRQNNGNGTYVLNTFDVAGNITLLENRKSDSSLLSSFAYTVDNVANRLSITESVLGTDNTTYHNATVSYGYDNLYRLTSEHRVPANPGANNPAFWYEYQYDPAGNRLLLTQKDEAGNVTGTTASTYDAANKLLTAGNTTYTWDANGNQTGKTVNNATTTYVWDHEDKMTQLHDGVTMTFTTDASGFRRSLTKDGAVIYFLYDRRSNLPGLDSLIAELDATGATTVHYIHANGLLAQKRGETTHWCLYEAVGSTRQLSDANQSVTDTYTYEAFGNAAASIGSTPNAYKYVGKLGYYNNGQTGLLALGMRYLDPQVGRMASTDPWSLALNRFSYATNNPATRTDPTGLITALQDYNVPGDWTWARFLFFWLQYVLGSDDLFLPVQPGTITIEGDALTKLRQLSVLVQMQQYVRDQARQDATAKCKRMSANSAGSVGDTNTVVVLPRVSLTEMDWLLTLGGFSVKWSYDCQVQRRYTVPTLRIPCCEECSYKCHITYAGWDYYDFPKWNPLGWIGGTYWIRFGWTDDVEGIAFPCATEGIPSLF